MCSQNTPTESTGTSLPSYDLTAWRKRIPLLERYVALNSCSRGPLMDLTRLAADSYLDSWNESGMDWPGWMAEVEAAKAEFSGLINADPDEVAVTTSVSAATASVAGAIDFSGTRNRVVASGGEFPTVGQVWLAHQRLGAEVDFVPTTEAGTLEPATYEPFLTESTAVVSACHGFYQNGFVQDIAAIAERAHAAGATIFVDAYQTLGTRPIDVKDLDVDFLTSGCLKYLMGSPGIAFLYIRPELINTLHPLVTGWFGRRNPFEFDSQKLDWAVTASRLETGTPPILAAYIARAGMAAIREVGPAHIHSWTQLLVQEMLEVGAEKGLDVLGSRDSTRQTPSVAFRSKIDSAAVESAMRDRGFLVSARGPAIRLAPHFFNTLEEVTLGVCALAEVLELSS